MNTTINLIGKPSIPSKFIFVWDEMREAIFTNFDRVYGRAVRILKDNLKEEEK